MKTSTINKFTPKQIQALREIILGAEEIEPVARLTLMRAIELSKNLSRPVMVSFKTIAPRELRDRKMIVNIIEGVRTLAFHTISINAVLEAMGSELRVAGVEPGEFIRKKFDEMRPGCTIYLLQQDGSTTDFPQPSIHIDGLMEILDRAGEMKLQECVRSDHLKNNL